MKKIMCSLLCPMLNQYGFCESAMRRVERVQECPHDKLRAVSKLNTEVNHDEHNQRDYSGTQPGNR